MIEVNADKTPLLQSIPGNHVSKILIINIKELLEKNFIVKRKQKDGRSYWLSLSEKFFQTFAVSNEYLSQIGSNKN